MISEKRRKQMSAALLGLLLGGILLQPTASFALFPHHHHIYKASLLSSSSAVTVQTALKAAPSDNDKIDRRTLLSCVLGSFSSFQLMPVLASDSEGTRPTAPVEALIPATRVKLLIDEATLLASDLANLDKSEKLKQEQILEKLKDLLLTPRTFISVANEVPRQPAQAYLNTYKNQVDQLPALAKPGALLVQNGEIQTWRKLKRQERAREDKDEIRAALNAYTHEIAYSADSYRWNGSSAERSQRIRQDQLPDVKTVIMSDMGLRYLYRNEVLTAMQDVRAELQYQLQQQADDAVDATDLVDLLRQAEKACGKWFGLIDEEEIQKALDVLRSSSS